MKRVIFEFENEEIRKAFLAWFCDGGGENDFYSLVYHSGIAVIVDYKRAFKGWGYDPKKHGPDKVVEVKVYQEEE